MNRLKLGDLRAISLISGGLSFEGAAVVMGTTPGQIRNQIIRIEAVMGRDVYIKKRHARVKLTPFGERVARMAGSLIEQADQFSRAID